MMRFWNRLIHGRSKDKHRHDQSHSSRQSNKNATGLQNSRTSGSDLTQRLTPALLDQIFRYVCPHATDETYASNENAPLEDRCFLCDTRDLAECARVRRSWKASAYSLLYRSVRLDICHYCYLEDELVERRLKKKRPEDPTVVRLRLIADTVRANPHIGTLVHFFKLPILTRQDSACFADLARAVGAMPNLEYVDLPENLYRGDPGCDILWMEIQQNCQNLARMQFHSGSELKFRTMHGRLWSHIRVLEIQGLRVDVQTLRLGLGGLHALEELTLSDVTTIDDQVFFQSAVLPVDFPVLRILSIEKCPSITAHGLVTYLSRQEVKHNFVNLSLSHSGVALEDLHHILAAAPRLETMSIVEEVKSSMPLNPIPPMRSSSLSSLHYEITSCEGAVGPADIDFGESYYMYLSSSLTAHALPNLRDLYVRYPEFVNLLVMPPPVSIFGQDDNVPTSPFGLLHELSIYTKGPDHDSWFSSIIPSSPIGTMGNLMSPGLRTKSLVNSAFPAFSPHLDHLQPPPPLFGGEAGNRASIVSLSGQPGHRALSVYGTSRAIGPLWGGEAVKSIVVANPEKAGFLVLPQENVEPVPSGYSDMDSKRISVLSAPGVPDNNGFLAPTGIGHRRHHSHFSQGSPHANAPRKKKSAIDLWR